MDPARFDRLVQTLTQPDTRRRVLGFALAAALLPGMATAAPEPDKCRANGKRCRQSAAGDARRGNGKRKGKHHAPPCSNCCSGFGATGADGKVRCACNATTCPQGCCDPASQSCQPGASNDVCGSGGAACETCVGDAVCQAGACACPSGGEPVHGGCFTTCDPNQPACPSACFGCFGAVAGSGNFVCANLTDTSCATNADCPAGQACWLAQSCAAPC
jgi:hypothetical protein